MLRISEGLLRETFAQLRECGAGRDECVVYWTGPIDEAERADRLLHPRHSSGAAGYEVDPRWLDRTWLELAHQRRQIRAQVHTHPATAFHSPTDDGFAVIQTAGFLSLVIPDFAMGPVGLDATYLAELTGEGSWADRMPSAMLEVCDERG